MLMGGRTREGGHRHLGGLGPNFDRLYHKMKVLLLLLLLCCYCHLGVNMTLEIFCHITLCCTITQF